jgi:hypothetical protein
MDLTATQQRHLRAAFAHARTLCRKGATDAELVWQAWVDAYDVRQRLPDPAYSSHKRLRSRWPSLVRTPEENQEAYAHMVEMVLAGRLPQSALMTKTALTPEQVSASESIIALFPLCMTERFERLDKRVSLLERDRDILSELASRKASGRRGRAVIAKKYHKTGPWLDNLKKIQCRAIAEKLRTFIGAHPPSSGRILYEEQAAA